MLLLLPSKSVHNNINNNGLWSHNFNAELIAIFLFFSWSAKRSCPHTQLTFLHIFSMRTNDETRIIYYLFHFYYSSEFTLFYFCPNKYLFVLLVNVQQIYLLLVITVVLFSTRKVLRFIHCLNVYEIVSQPTSIDEYPLSNMEQSTTCMPPCFYTNTKIQK